MANDTTAAWGKPPHAIIMEGAWLENGRAEGRVLLD